MMIVVADIHDIFVQVWAELAAGRERRVILAQQVMNPVTTTQATVVFSLFLLVNREVGVEESIDAIRHYSAVFSGM